MSKFYAVRVGQSPGIYRSWAECKAQVDGFSGASYKSFVDLPEAESWLRNPCKTFKKPNKKKQTRINAYNKKINEKPRITGQHNTNLYNGIAPPWN